MGHKFPLTAVSGRSLFEPFHGGACAMGGLPSTALPLGVLVQRCIPYRFRRSLKRYPCIRISPLAGSFQCPTGYDLRGHGVRFSTNRRPARHTAFASGLIPVCSCSPGGCHQAKKSSPALIYCILRFLMKPKWLQKIAYSDF